MLRETLTEASQTYRPTPLAELIQEYSVFDGKLHPSAWHMELSYPQWREWALRQEVSHICIPFPQRDKDRLSQLLFGKLPGPMECNLTKDEAEAMYEFHFRVLRQGTEPSLLNRFYTPSLQSPCPVCAK